jgi:large subunit ribosomal protein L21
LENILMYAIVRSGGRQYRAEPGVVIVTEKLTAEPGTTLDLGDVLLVVGDNGQAVIGTPVVQGASVRVTVLDHYRAKKVIAFRYRSKHRLRRKRGHRQTYTRLKVESITV